MNKDQFILSCREARWDSLPSDLIESLTITDYSDVKEILSSNYCVNFLTCMEGLFSKFLAKTIKGEPIGSLVSDDGKLFSHLCHGWVFNSDLMEYAQGDQIDRCAKYYINYATENISYEIAEGKKTTFFEYIIEQLREKYSGNMFKILADKCANLIISDISKTINSKFL